MKLDTIKKPIITEKTLQLAEGQNKYTFEVSRDANKVEIAKAIKAKFEVEPIAVKIINTLGKNVRFGRLRRQAKQSDTKKAIVELKSGDKIGLFNIK